MGEKIPKFVDLSEARNIISLLGKEFAIVQNPSYLFPRFEIYPLAPKISTPRKKLVAVVKDMDGTTTTTEQLCLHSQEYMIGQITGKWGDPTWKGLDKVNDYPHIIGNSTTRHVEYLINKYGKFIKMENFRKSYLTAILWTLSQGKDEGRRREVRSNMVALGWGNMLTDNEFLTLITRQNFEEKRYQKEINHLLQKYGKFFHPKDFTDKVRAAIDIYYYRYHQILSLIDKGEGERLSKELLHEEERRLIEPMPGVEIFLSLIKGWLGEDLVLFYEELAEHLLTSPYVSYTQNELDKFRKRLAPLGRYFSIHPIKVGIVTSSIAYEANVVLKEVFRVAYERISHWKIPSEKKEKILENFSDYKKLYDSIITANDSSEIRLKPHHDLYSMALHEMGVSKDEFPFVIGFEDSESGTIALRAAGIGLCIALPFTDTSGHDFTAATRVIWGGLPEVILVNNLFLSPSVLKNFE